MSYNYQTERAAIFTEDGQRQFLQIRDNVERLIKVAGAVRMQEILTGVSGSNWTHIACVDRLVELGEIIELPTTGWGQYRVFTRPGRD